MNDCKENFLFPNICENIIIILYWLLYTYTNILQAK